jgi:hypothetical protein
VIGNRKVDVNVLAMAEKKCLEVASVKPDHVPTLTNWGLILTTKAEMMEMGNEQRKLFELAVEKFSAANPPYAV